SIGLSVYGAFQPVVTSCLPVQPASRIFSRRMFGDLVSILLGQGCTLRAGGGRHKIFTHATLPMTNLQK
ncbi:MAG: hypothetical protein LBC18_06830, partial [Opitutaceae bacterium]|nr:hypothetical protein [Opitutaceae bacterium]